MKNKKDRAENSEQPRGDMIAKKDWEIHHNEHHIKIKKGDDCSRKVPEKFWPSLKAEKVV